MHVLIICKVIDNYGDAGFCLRLARAIATQGHSVTLLHDNAAVFEDLLEPNPPKALDLCDAQDAAYRPEKLPQPDLIIEPFGTSAEQWTHRHDVPLKALFPNCPWILLDYLSAESWVEGFHKSQSIDPKTGHRVTYFYPGFGERTAGVIHCDAPALAQEPRQDQGGRLSLFVFCYANAPLEELMAASRASGDLVGFAGAAMRKVDLPPHWRALPFCPQTEFDNRLAEHDVLFVRGEDSFVRAQLAGKPLVWQIYPTDDAAHAVKLKAFFDVYSAAWAPAERNALWRLWTIWNRLDEEGDLMDAWLEVRSFWPILHAHSRRWRTHLQEGPELVKELLTWCAQRSPTFDK
ncbi:MAG TPA: elongation factor P maturation arginine rhamnosyltransferase EarP [Limnobacter sp.]|nr:elongation factor P maturation arginine rhamnosyltransferase EarP [Limnobacter sp.]